MQGRTLYIDCFSGIAGDMFLGALFDLAEHLECAEQVNPSRLKLALQNCSLPPWNLELISCTKLGLEGKKLRVLTPWGEEKVEDLNDDHRHSHVSLTETNHKHSHETSLESSPNQLNDHSHESLYDHVHGLNFLEIKTLIETSRLSKITIERALKVFELIGQAESRAHGVPMADVHFHEVGMLDSIIDILGVAWCLEQLNIKRILSAPPPINRGWVRCAHGVLPLPAPATAFILEGLKTCPSPHHVELITPTGAAMIKAWADVITSNLPSLPVEAIGLGAGQRDLKDRPNLLRLFAYSSEQSDLDSMMNIDRPSTSCWLYESNIDDMRAEDLAVLTELLFKAGALDVWQSSIMMKKNRLACLLSVLCTEADAQQIESTLLFHSTSIGCRRQRVERKVLRRRFLNIDTKWGPCRIKVSRLRSNEPDTKDLWRYKPELEDLKALASESGQSIEALRAHIYVQLNTQSYPETEAFWASLKLENK